MVNSQTAEYGIFDEISCVQECLIGELVCKRNIVMHW